MTQTSRSGKAGSRSGKSDGTTGWQPWKKVEKPKPKTRLPRSTTDGPVTDGKSTTMTVTLPAGSFEDPFTGPVAEAVGKDVFADIMLDMMHMEERGVKKGEIKAHVRKKLEAVASDPKVQKRLNRIVESYPGGRKFLKLVKRAGKLPEKQQVELMKRVNIIGTNPRNLEKLIGEQKTREIERQIFIAMIEGKSEEEAVQGLVFPLMNMIMEPLLVEYEMKKKSR